MDIELSPNQEKELRELATKTGKPVEQVAGELLERALFSKKTPENGAGASDPAYEPSRTELGRTLRSLSRRYVESGGKLYSIDEINREVAEGRGER